MCPCDHRPAALGGSPLWLEQDGGGARRCAGDRPHRAHQQARSAVEGRWFAPGRHIDVIVRLRLGVRCYGAVCMSCLSKGRSIDCGNRPHRHRAQQCAGHQPTHPAALNYHRVVLRLLARPIRARSDARSPGRADGFESLASRPVCLKSGPRPAGWPTAPYPPTPVSLTGRARHRTRRLRQDFTGLTQRVASLGRQLSIVVACDLKRCA